MRKSRVCVKLQKKDVMTNEMTGDRISQGMDKIADLQHNLVDRTRECAQATDSYVHDNPWVAVAIGAGIGLLMGLLISRGD
jgi:ElaB/YqjD/DUF883 family membrane-anchored ribosome-binding protein